MTHLFHIEMVSSKQIYVPMNQRSREHRMVEGMPFGAGSLEHSLDVKRVPGRHRPHKGIQQDKSIIVQVQPVVHIFWG